MPYLAQHFFRCADTTLPREGAGRELVAILQGHMGLLASASEQPAWAGNLEMLRGNHGATVVTEFKHWSGQSQLEKNDTCL